MSQGGALDEGSSTPVGPGRFPITPFVVGPAGQAGYQTIQSAVNAANAAGGGAVWVQPGIYTENLTLYTDVQIVGATGNSDIINNSSVVINGTHTPPISGFCGFVSIFLQSATDIISSNAAGTATIIFENCIFNVLDGYILNIVNWIGIIGMVNIEDNSSNNGVINNTAGSFIYLEECDLGAGTTKTMITTGIISFRRTDIGCFWSPQSGSIILASNAVYENTVTFSNNATAQFDFCRFSTGTNTAIIMNSSSNITLHDCIIDCSNNPAITGTGAGSLDTANIIFVNNANIAPTVVLNNTCSNLLGEISIGGDVGGRPGFTSLTKTNSTTIGAGTGTVKMSSGNNADNAAWIKIYIGTTAYWIPAWTTNAP